MTTDPKALDVLKMFVERITANGEWDDGCFYYRRTSASELQEPLRLARDLLAQSRPEQVEDEADPHLAAKRYIRDWVPGHVRDYVASLERPAPKPAGEVPTGWKLVPEEPLWNMAPAPEQIDWPRPNIYGDFDRSEQDEACRQIYCAMLAASPAPANAAPTSEREGA